MSEPAPERRSGARRWGPPVALVCLVSVSTFLRWAAARGIPSPWFTPDEEIYAALGRSLYRSARFEILGQATGYYSLVYPALAGLPLSFGDPVRGYANLKALQAFVMSLTAVPVYLWGRSLMSPGWALVASALTLSIPGLAFGGFIMTEVAFYPVLLLAAWGIARSLSRPTLWNQGLAVAGIALAVGTRLQAVVLAPVFFLAIGLVLVFARAPLRSALRFGPAFGGLLMLALAWALVSHGRVLGEYDVVGSTRYDVVDAARFSLYHAGDVLLLTAVLPAVAVALLASTAFSGRERSADARAYLAVTVALTAGLVVQVGLFASRFLVRLAERNLIGLAPVLFLGFALWLDRGAPRPVVPLAGVSAGVFGLLLFLPLSDFVTEAAEPDAFTIIPLYQFHLREPQVSLRLVVVAGAAALLVLLTLVPARARSALPLVVLALLVGASISASAVVASQARRYSEVMVGPQKRWIDQALPASAAASYLYGGELPWSGGAPVWVNVFWNRRIDRVYDLGKARVLGPIPQTPLVVAAPDGRLATQAGSVTSPPFVLASSRIALVGTRVASSFPARLTLWHPTPPLRLASATTGYDPWAGSLSPRATMTVYSCSRGSLELTTVARDEVRVEIDRNGVASRRARLAAGDRWSASVHGRPRDGVCRFTVRASPHGVGVERFEFVRTG